FVNPAQAQGRNRIVTPCAEPAVLSHRRTRTSGLSSKVNPMIARALRTIVILAAGVLSSGPFTALAEENVDSTALARALADPLATLRDGVKASEIAGIPISAKFEIEDGKLQLSVYTVNAGEFVEVIADPKTGAAIKTETATIFTSRPRGVRLRTLQRRLQPS